jgi:glucose-1-phosphate cytidylyltransferase
VPASTRRGGNDGETIRYDEARAPMKTVILAGGFGTRLSEETTVRPKPMVEIGGKPILWHIMKLYAAHGIDDFVVSAGYKSHVIKEWFASYYLHNADVVFDLGANSMQTLEARVEPWRVTVADTGDATMTGGRIKRVAGHLDGTFCMTYGDCVTDLDVTELIRFHRAQNVLATVTAIQPPGRFGVLALRDGEDKAATFLEKPDGDGGWVNGGFFVLEPEVVDYIDGDASIWEREPLERLAAEGQLAAYRHRGYWQNMDSLRDKMVLEQLWSEGSPPWKVW